MTFNNGGSFAKNRARARARFAKMFGIQVVLVALVVETRHSYHKGFALAAILLSIPQQYTQDQPKFPKLVPNALAVATVAIEGHYKRWIIERSFSGFWELTRAFDRAILEHSQLNAGLASDIMEVVEASFTEEVPVSRDVGKNRNKNVEDVPAGMK
jgi:hypothetical protein